MASTYRRADSPFIWIRYKSDSGAWKSANTGYRQDNLGERKQAELLAKQKSLEEMSNKPVQGASHRWEDWGVPWINGRWGNRSNRTPKMYKNYFWRWLEYFKEINVTQPVALRREHVVNYLEWRKRHGGGRNTAIHEIKFLGMLMDEAISRGYASVNPTRRLHLEKSAPVEKVAWSDFEVDQVGVALAERSKFGWMHVTFLMGLFQAVRLRQAQIPLSRIDFQRRIIDYPSDKVKAGRGYSQPIDPNFYPILQELVAHRRALGESHLCEIPLLPSVEWRRFLDELGLQQVEPVRARRRAAGWPAAANQFPVFAGAILSIMVCGPRGLPEQL